MKSSLWRSLFIVPIAPVMFAYSCYAEQGSSHSSTSGCDSSNNIYSWQTAAGAACEYSGVGWMRFVYDNGYTGTIDFGPTSSKAGNPSGHETTTISSACASYGGFWHYGYFQYKDISKKTSYTDGSGATRSFTAASISGYGSVGNPTYADGVGNEDNRDKNLSLVKTDISHTFYRKVGGKWQKIAHAVDVKSDATVKTYYDAYIAQSGDTNIWHGNLSWFCSAWPAEAASFYASSQAYVTNGSSSAVAANPDDTKTVSDNFKIQFRHYIRRKDDGPTTSVKTKYSVNTNESSKPWHSYESGNVTKKTSQNVARGSSEYVNNNPEYNGTSEGNRSYNLTTLSPGQTKIYWETFRVRTKVIGDEISGLDYSEHYESGSYEEIECNLMHDSDGDPISNRYCVAVYRRPARFYGQIVAKVDSSANLIVANESHTNETYDEYVIHDADSHTISFDIDLKRQESSGNSAGGTVSTSWKACSSTCSNGNYSSTDGSDYASGYSSNLSGLASSLTSQTFSLSPGQSTTICRSLEYTGIVNYSGNTTKSIRACVKVSRPAATFNGYVEFSQASNHYVDNSLQNIVADEDGHFRINAKAWISRTDNTTDGAGGTVTSRAQCIHTPLACSDTGSVSLRYGDAAAEPTSNAISKVITHNNIGGGSALGDISNVGGKTADFCYKFKYQSTVSYALGNLSSLNNRGESTAERCIKANRPYNYLTEVGASNPNKPLYVLVGGTGSIQPSITIRPRVNEFVTGLVTAENRDSKMFKTNPKNTKYQVLRFSLPASESLASVGSLLQSNYSYQTDNNRNGDTQLSCASIVKNSTSRHCQNVALSGSNTIANAGAYDTGTSTLNLNKLSFSVPTDQEIGSKICFVVAAWPADSHDQIASGAEDIKLNRNNPADNYWGGIAMTNNSGRYWHVSTPTCYTVAQRPSLRINGGGAYVDGEITTSQSTQAATTKTVGYSGDYSLASFDLTYKGTLLSPPRTYRFVSSETSGSVGVSSESVSSQFYTSGSWAEYDLRAGEKISGMASGAALLTSRQNAADCTISTMTLTNSRCNTANTLGYKPLDMNSSASPTKLIEQVRYRYVRTSGFTPMPDGSTADFEGYCKYDDATGAYVPRPAVAGGNIGNFACLNNGSMYGYINGSGFTGSNNATIQITDEDTGIVLEARGTVTIRGNITHQPGGSGWSSTDIPQWIIIAKKVVILDNVTNIDAWLIADEVDTCQPADGSAIAAINSPPRISPCEKQLTINGPIIAKKVHLNRTTGGQLATATSTTGSGATIDNTAYPDVSHFNSLTGGSSVRSQYLANLCFGGDVALLNRLLNTSSVTMDSATLDDSSIGSLIEQIVWNGANLESGICRHIVRNNYTTTTTTKIINQPAETITLSPAAYLWSYDQASKNAQAVTTYQREMPVRY